MTICFLFATAKYAYLQLAPVSYIERFHFPKPISVIDSNRSTFKWKAFDPNDVSNTFLMNSGLQQKVVSTWESYLRAGGRFQEKKDLMKIYGMDSLWFTKASPHIVFKAKPKDDDQETKSKKKTYSNTKKELKKTNEFERSANLNIELNACNVEDLISLKGIGLKTAEAIIKLRSGLGGFYSLDQLMGIYGVEPDEIELWSRSITIDHEKVETLDLKEDSFKELLSHPYLNYQQVVGLKNFVSQFEDPPLLEELIHLEGFDSISAVKIYPYINKYNN